MKPGTLLKVEYLIKLFRLYARLGQSLKQKTGAPASQETRGIPVS